ncbi:hypothetical protein [Cupriavidus sp. amp6]|uniref:hypothetical protein n=1 Tax=Cupriavidus sp. amp6 TaxID=388051 RepID=UPI00048F5D55|nr:hypothetical protein [Cupriavidus sp. amp6]
MEADDKRIAAEDARRHWNSLDTALIEATKACLILNGGSVVAMLGLLQNLLAKSQGTAFKPYALGAAALFLIGAVCVVPAFGHRSAMFRKILAGNAEEAVHRDNSSLTWLGGSILAFVLGAIAAGAGIAIAL